MIRITYNPIDDLIKIANEMYPDADASVEFIEFTRQDTDDAYGYALFPHDGSTPTIAVSASKNTIADCLDVISREVAHIVAGKDHQHDEVFQSHYDQIYRTYQAYAEAAFKEEEG